VAGLSVPFESLEHGVIHQTTQASAAEVFRRPQQFRFRSTLEEVLQQHLL
jgi:hypothetical protein